MRPADGRSSCSTSRRATERTAMRWCWICPTRSCSRATCRRVGCSAIRPRRDLVVVRHDGLLAGRRHPGSSALAGDPRPAAFPRPDDPLLQARRYSCRGGNAFSTGRPAGRPRCWPRGRAVSSARPRTEVWWPCSIRGWPRRRTAASCSATLPPMRRTVERDEKASFLRRALGGSD